MVLFLHGLIRHGRGLICIVVFRISKNCGLICTARTRGYPCTRVGVRSAPIRYAALICNHLRVTCTYTYTPELIRIQHNLNVYNITLTKANDIDATVKNTDTTKDSSFVSVLHH